MNPFDPFKVARASWIKKIQLDVKDLVIVALLALVLLLYLIRPPDQAEVIAQVERNRRAIERVSVKQDKLLAGQKEVAKSKVAPVNVNKAETVITR